MRTGNYNTLNTIRVYPMKNIMAVFTLALLTGCENSRTVKGEGETPAKFVSCPLGEKKECFVAARFQDLDRCESYKAWAEMFCDQTSSPGQMICSRDRSIGNELSVSRCTL